MKIKDGFVVEKVGGNYLAVAVGDRAEEINALIKMNSTGAYLWQLLSENDLTEAEAAGAMAREYGIDISIAERDVATFLTKLRSSGLLDE